MLPGTTRVGHTFPVFPTSGMLKNAPLRRLLLMACTNMGPIGGMAKSTSPLPEGARPGPVRGPLSHARHPGPAGGGEPGLYRDRH